MLNPAKQGGVINQSDPNGKAIAMAGEKKKIWPWIAIGIIAIIILVLAAILIFG